MSISSLLSTGIVSPAQPKAANANGTSTGRQEWLSKLQSGDNNLGDAVLRHHKPHFHASASDIASKSDDLASANTGDDDSGDPLSQLHACQLSNVNITLAAQNVGDGDGTPVTSIGSAVLGSITQATLAVGDDDDSGGGFTIGQPIPVNHGSPGPLAKLHVTNPNAPQDSAAGALIRAVSTVASNSSFAGTANIANIDPLNILV